MTGPLIELPEIIITASEASEASAATFWMVLALVLVLFWPSRSRGSS